ncbi:uncharacterized protein Z518_08779 [Rhinocladiella mackenziei CBS 650.93]|uniref:Uncharacterized protein n=1 Tax=Rhinocladiella mackenziei CBS 650.93 TaxID=1442369 RepID=A0A0D2IHQ7_9EURO|nr:uncharacterized protein Z518_08779 [Rhinocladiella mackenziei CBS 650.93]KIX02836.1 hypothetical protein Z518_08779 [Rhinocladiella mackenziei CBS 650.93]
MAGPLLHSDSKSSRRRWLIGIVVFTIIAILITTSAHFRGNSYGDLSFPAPGSETGSPRTLRLKEFIKPEGIKIIGLVFFGRKNRVEILRCFLERNLVDNGGWLDEIHWVKNTDKKIDLVYLDEILASSPRYKKIELEGVGFVGYGYAWSRLERGHLYVKIDDDVVWFADDTIPRIVTMKLANPNYLLVSANIVNSPLMGWVHYHMGAMHPYLPEFDVYEPPLLEFPHPSRKPWQYSAYPYWTGPDDYFFDMFQDPPYDGHRWLRMVNDSAIHRTPITEIEYKTWGNGLKSWAIAAQEHYSFLENLADGRLDRYKTGGKAWLTDYKRLSINFVALWADDVLDNLPMDTVDEEWLTINLPKRLGRSVAVETDALAVHFTFGTQGKVEKTDLLPRYHDYALENACARKV